MHFFFYEYIFSCWAKTSPCICLFGWLVALQPSSCIFSSSSALPLFQKPLAATGLTAGVEIVCLVSLKECKLCKTPLVCRETVKIRDVWVQCIFFPLQHVWQDPTSVLLRQPSYFVLSLDCRWYIKPQTGWLTIPMRIRKKGVPKLPIGRKQSCETEITTASTQQHPSVSSVKNSPMLNASSHKVKSMAVNPSSTELPLLFMWWVRISECGQCLPSISFLGLVPVRLRSTAGFPLTSPPPEPRAAQNKKLYTMQWYFTPPD